MLIVSRQYNQIEVLISCVGVCIALVNIFLGRLFQTSFKYKLNALNFLLIPCLALLLWTEISKLFYDICIDYPFDRRPQCKSEKMLFLPLALYSFSGLLLSAASFRVSLVISAYFQKIEDKEQAELLRESDGSQNLSKAEVLDIPENSI